jgi:hypothetical protein
MTDKEQELPCSLCCGNLSLSMTKEEMQGLLETLIERNLTLTEFAQRNSSLTSVDKFKRIQELSSEALEANKLLEQLLHHEQKATDSAGFNPDYYDEHE